MSSQPIEVPIDLDLGDYTTQAGAAVGVTDQLARSMGALEATTRPLQRALDTVSPKHVALAGLGAFSYAAAGMQKDMSGIAATARVTHAPLNQLYGDVRSLSREFPIGQAGAVGMVQAVQQLGVQAPPRIRAVARETTQLALATGSLGPSITLGFGQLNREMASLDPARLSRFGDVVTTVAARSGAAATDLISFGKGIAPIAQQAGIGESAVLGIAGAFAKLGDDGYSAVTAVNKILGDLNRSVREGSNDIAGYAQILGTTPQALRQQFTANPAQALASITSAIGQAGPRGSYQLETLGLDGVRTQRALLELSQSGGLSGAVNQAVASYGNGATGRAAAAATSNLDDSLTRLGSTLSQVGEVAGAPVLQPLTQLTSGLQRLAEPLVSIAGSGGIQHLISYATYAGLGAFALRRTLGVGGGVATGVLGLTSGPVRGLAAGIAYGRAGAGATMEEIAAQGAFGRYGAPMLERYTLGQPLGRGPMGGLNTGALRLGEQVGSYFPVGVGGGYGLRAFASDLPYLGGAGVGSYLRSQAEIFRLARTPAAERQLVMRPYGAAYDRFAENRQTLIGARQAGTLTGADYRTALGKELSLLRDEVHSTGAVFAGMRQAGTGFLSVLREGAMFGGYAGGRIGGALASRAGGFLLDHPIMTGLAVGYEGYQLYKANQAEQQRSDAHVAGLDIYSTVNAYRDSLGLAGQATVTLADQMKAAADTISQSVSSMPQATAVSTADITAARTNPRIIHTYAGNTQQIGAQIAGMNVGGLTPQDVQAAKLDLLRMQQQGQLSSSFDINAALTYATSNGSAGPTGAQLAQMVTGAAQTPGIGHVGFGWRDIQRGLANRFSIPGAQHLWESLGHTGAGTPQLGSAGQGQVDLMLGTLGQIRQAGARTGGDAYGMRRELTAADKMMTAAIATHNADLVVGMEQQFTKALTGTAIRGTSANDIAMAGGFLPWLRSHRGVSIGGYGLGSVLGATATSQASPLVTELSGNRTSGLLGLLTGSASGAYNTAINSPDNLRKQTKAVEAIVDASTKAGMSLGQLARQSAIAASGMNPADVSFQIQQGVQAETQFRLQNNLIGANRSTSFGQRSNYFLGLANTNLPGDAGQQARAQGRAGLQQVYQEEVGYYQQRLMAQFQFQLASERSEEDYQRQITRSEQDFARQRYRAFRDYNIQLTRIRQDAAQQAYDPYTRIQVQPVWDARNLMGNQREQVQALTQQVHNVNRLKAMGLSDQAVRYLQLYDPNKAQQVTELVADFSAEPRLIGQENRIATRAADAAYSLAKDAPSFQRQRQDFRRAMSDTRIDFNIAQSRQAEDFGIAMNRMAEDLRNSDLEITNDMTTLQADMNRILHGQTVDFTGAIRNQLKDTLHIVGEYAPKIKDKLGIDHTQAGSTSAGSGVTATGGRSGGGYGNNPVGGGGGGTAVTLPSGKHIPGAGESAPTSYVKPGTGNVYGGYTTDSERPSDTFINSHRADPEFNMSIAKSMKPGWAKGKIWKAWHDMWQVESGWNQYAYNPADPNNYGQGAYGIPQAYPGRKMASTGKDWQTNPATQIRWGIGHMAGYGDPYQAAQKMHFYNPDGSFPSSAYKGYADGGIALTAHYGKVAETGRPEAMIPLDRRGVDFLAEAIRSYISGDDAKMLSVAGNGVTIHYEHHEVDAGLHIDGPVTVKANSPAEWAAQAHATQRAANLTGPRGVRWSRSTP